MHLDDFVAWRISWESRRIIWRRWQGAQSGLDSFISSMTIRRSAPKWRAAFQSLTVPLPAAIEETAIS